MEGQTKTFQFPDAVVRVHFPDLTDEERERRMRRVRKAAEDILKDKFLPKYQRKEEGA